MAKLIGVLSTLALAASPSGAAAGASLSPGGALTKGLESLVAMREGPPGAIVVVQRNARVDVYRAGVRDLKTGAPIRPTDLMRIASVAKAFSGAVALKLVDRRVLRLSDTISRWLPDLPRRWGRATLGQALNHTSGLPDFTGSPAFVNWVKRHLRATPSPRFLLKFVAGRPLDFTPGSKYHYSNSDNIVVGLMAEAAAKRSYNRLLASLVFSPLHLTSTSLPTGFRMGEPFLHGYDPDPPRPPEDVSELASAALAWASGGIVSTPTELTRFIRAYAGARLVSRATRSQQLRLVDGHSDPIGPGVNKAGLGIFRYRTRCGTVYGHTGNTFGYTQLAAATLDGRRSVVASVSAQMTQDSKGERLAAFRRLRALEEDAVCLALG